MYNVITSKAFEKDYKRCQKRGLNIKLLQDAISILASDGKLPPEYRPHILSGKYAGIWECHIKGDWLMTWRQYDDRLELLMLNTGSHSDLFK